MDILYFLKERTRFIRYYYETAAEPFHEIKRKIKAKEEPFDDPPYSEDVEPPFLEEWIEAETALEILGRTCILLLSTSLQLYFRTWESELDTSTNRKTCVLADVWRDAGGLVGDGGRFGALVGS